MTDFEAALRQQLARNDDFARQREAAEAEMDRVRQAQEESRRQEAQRLRQERHDRHAELVEHLTDVAAHLKAASPEKFIVRSGWTESGEEFLAKISTRKTSPARSLLVELDRDDDEVLARWSSDVGTSVELWRLLDVNPAMLSELVLQVADEPLWRNASSPPAFPGSQ